MWDSGLMWLIPRAGSRREREGGRCRRSVPESASWDSELPGTAPLRSARACRQPFRSRRRTEKTLLRRPVWCGSYGPRAGAGFLAEPAAGWRPRRCKGSGPPALPPRSSAAVRLAALEVRPAAPPEPKLTHLVDEAQSLPEVVEPEGPSQMVLLDDLPFGDLLPERVELLPLEGRNTALARYARLASQFGHSVPPEKMNLLRKDLMCRNFSLSSFGLLVSSRQYHISSTPKY